MAEPIDFFGLAKKTDDAAKNITTQIDPLADLFSLQPGPKTVLNAPPSDPLNLNQLFSNQSLKQETESGFFNQLASVVSIPQQVLYTAGKNLGEEIMGRELSNKRFGEELMDAIEGRGSMTFNDILKSVDMDELDFKIPGLDIQNPYMRIPAAILVGIGSGILAGPAAGIAVGFGLEGAARGKGLISSIADVFVDPLNKLRLFQTTRKGTEALRGATKADSYLTQIAKGERAIFDLEGSLGLGKPIDAFFDAAFKPIDLVGKNAGRILNAPGAKWVQDVANPFTGMIDARVVQPVVTGLFQRNGALALGKYSGELDIDAVLDTAVEKYPEMIESIRKSDLSPAKKLQKFVNEMENIGELRVAKAAEDAAKVMQENFDNDNLLKLEGASALRKLGFMDESVVRKVSAEDPAEMVARIQAEAPTMKDNMRLRDDVEMDLQRRNANIDTTLRKDTQTKINQLSVEADRLMEQREQLAPLPPSAQKFLKKTAKEIGAEEHFELVLAANAAGLGVEATEQTADILRKLRAKAGNDVIGARLDDIYKEMDDYAEELRKVEGGNRIDTVERQGMADLITTMFGKEMSENIRAFWSDAGSAIREGTDEANEIAVQLVTNFKQGDMNKPMGMFMNIYGAAGIDDAFHAISNSVFDNLFGKNAAFTEMVQKINPKLTDPASLRAAFEDQFYSAAKYGKAKADAATSGFLGKVVDGVRGFFRMMEGMIRGKQFRSNDVHKQILGFMNDGNYFEKLRKAGAEGGETLLSKGAVTKNSLAEDALAAMKELKAAGMLPEGLGMKPSVNGLVPIPLYEHRDAFEQIRQAGYDYGALTSADISKAGSKRQALYTSPQQQNLIAAIVDPKNESYVKGILSDAEYDELAQLGSFNNGKFTYRGDLSSIAQPGTPAWNSLQKIRETYEVIPWGMYETNLATLKVHMARSLGQVETAGVIKAIDKIAVGSEKQLLKRVKASLINSLDAAFIQPEAANDIATVLRKFPSLKAQDEIENGLRLLAKQDLTSKEYIELRDTLFRASEKMPVDGRAELLRVMEALPANTADAAVSPTLTRAAALNRLVGKKNISEKELAGALGVDEFTAGALEQSPQFKKITQEIEAKRGGTPQLRKGEQQLPLDDKVLDTKLRTKEELKALKLQGWEKFNPKGSVPPLLEPMRGKMIPKELSRWMSTSEVNLGKSFEQSGKLIGRVVKGFNDVEAATAVKSGADALESSALGQKFFPKGVGEGVRNAGSRLLSSANLDYITNIFKSQILVSPSYHVRNAVSGLVVNLMHGVKPSAHAEALDFMLKQRYNKKTGEKIASWWNEFVSGGGSGQGQLAEIQRDVGRFQGVIDRPAISANPVSMNFGVYRMNFEFGQYVDDAFRFASYIDARKQGKNAFDSIQQVKQLHFDYNDLSDFERTVMKRTIPFYTYFRKALARDSRLFMERTGNYYKMGHVLQQVERGVEDPEDSEVVASFIRERLGVPFRRNPETGAVEYFMLSNWIPAADFVARFMKDGDVVKPTEAFFEFMKENAANLTPILKLPLEIALNHDFYFGKKIQEYEGEESDFWGFGVDARMVKLLRMIRVFNDVDKLVKTQVPRADRPDLPLEDPTSALVNVFGGAKVRANLDPQLQFDRNVERPLRDLRRQAKREAARGDTVNTETLRQALQEGEKLHAEKSRRAAKSLGRVRKGDQIDPLATLFARPNPENLPR